MKQKLQSKKGFTLVELMIVVVIMGILVAVAIPVYNSATKNTKIKSCASNVRVIQENLSQWTMTGNGGDEVSLTDIDAIFGTAGTTLYDIKTAAGDTKAATGTDAEKSAAEHKKALQASLISLFDEKTFPVCPFEKGNQSAANSYKIVSDITSGTAKFKVTCVSENTADAAHKVAITK